MRWPLAYSAFVAGLTIASPGHAAPGDIHRVSGAELVNLRAAPSNESNVRGRVDGGDEVIELTSEGNWIGVRVFETGEEGWIFGDLLERVATSGLRAGGSPAGVPDVGLMQLSEGFNALVHRIGQDLGYPLIESTSQPGQGVLRITPTAAWLRNGSRDSHLMAATAFYQMWKNYHNGERVTLVLTDPGGDDYIMINDTDSGPDLSVRAP